MVSFVAVGEGASATVFDGPHFDGLKLVIGELSEYSLARLIRFESTWDNSVYSLILQVSCFPRLRGYKCTKFSTTPVDLTFSLLQTISV